MVKFVQVDPKDIPTDRLGRRGRVSYPLIKGFMEANIKMAKLDTTGLEKNPAYLRCVLQSYIKTHAMPIKLFSASGDLFMMRLDLNNDGTPIEGYQPPIALGTTEGNAGLERDREPTPLDADEIRTRFESERGQTTK